MQIMKANVKAKFVNKCDSACLCSSWKNMWFWNKHIAQVETMPQKELQLHEMSHHKVMPHTKKCCHTKYGHTKFVSPGTTTEEHNAIAKVYATRINMFHQCCSFWKGCRLSLRCGIHNIDFGKVNYIVQSHWPWIGLVLTFCCTSFCWDHLYFKCCCFQSKASCSFCMPLCHKVL